MDVLNLDNSALYYIFVLAGSSMIN